MRHWCPLLGMCVPGKYPACSSSIWRKQKSHWPRYKYCYLKNKNKTKHTYNGSQG